MPKGAVMIQSALLGSNRTRRRPNIFRINYTKVKLQCGRRYVAVEKRSRI